MKRKDMVMRLTYSLKIIKEKKIELKSVWNPATNSLSASGKSKGTLLDSAKILIKEIMKNKLKEKIKVKELKRKGKKPKAKAKNNINNESWK